MVRRARMMVLASHTMGKPVPENTILIYARGAPFGTSLSANMYETLVLWSLA